MNEQATPAGQENQDNVPQSVSIHSIYLKDSSFESPNSPSIFGEKSQPGVQVNLSINTNQLAEETHEVVLAVTVTAKLGERTAFLAEVQQGGVFTLRGFSKEELGPVLGIYCPNMLFPYAREAVASMVSKGGFPQLLLEPVNFEALYTQHLQQQAQPLQ